MKIIYWPIIISLNSIGKSLGARCPVLLEFHTGLPYNNPNMYCFKTENSILIPENVQYVHVTSNCPKESNIINYSYPLRISRYYSSCREDNFRDDALRRKFFHDVNNRNNKDNNSISNGIKIFTTLDGELFRSSDGGEEGAEEEVKDLNF